jgi:hypothetical protein
MKSNYQLLSLLQPELIEKKKKHSPSVVTYLLIIILKILQMEF